MSLCNLLAKNLHTIKKQKRLSTEALAEMLGISKTALQTYLNGRGNPTLKTVEMMARKLGISPEALLSARRSDWSPSLLETLMAKLSHAQRVAVTHEVINGIINMLGL